MFSESTSGIILLTPLIGSLNKKSECSFPPIQYCNFYPSITEKLLMAVINLANIYCPIRKQNINIIKQAKKPILFHEGSLWTNRSHPDFSIAMGALDSVEACELVSILLLLYLKPVFFNIKKTYVGMRGLYSYANQVAKKLTV